MSTLAEKIAEAYAVRIEGYDAVHGPQYDMLSDEEQAQTASALREVEALRNQLEAAKAETNDVRKAANAEIDCLSRASQKEIESWQNERNHARADQEAAEAALANARSQLVSMQSAIRDAYYAGYFEGRPPIAINGVDRAVREEEAAWKEYAAREGLSVSDEPRHPAMDWKLSGADCPQCRGDGRIGIIACTVCGASGRVALSDETPTREQIVGMDSAMKRARERAQTDDIQKSAPGFKAAENTAQSDPSVRPDWAGADTALTDDLRIPPMCEECGKDRADTPSKLCPGCQAYREHQA